MRLAIGFTTFDGIKDFAEASRIYSDARDKSGKGASEFPVGKLFDDSGKTIANVSYNGRVWANQPKHWKPGDVPLFG